MSKPEATLEDLKAQASRLSVTELASVSLADLQQRWRRGERVPAETYLSQLPVLREHTDGILDLIYAEVLVREELGEAPTVDEYIRRFPNHEPALRRQFNLHSAVKSQLIKDSAQRDTPPQEGDPETRYEAIKAHPKGDELHGQFGRYRIERLLGKGGMGAVYLAHDTQLDRLVALKVLRMAAHGSDLARERFLREARAAAALEHPNICPVYDVGTVGNVPYLTMAFIDGKSLMDFTRERLPPRQVAVLVRRLALALAEAHQRGVIHRDLKPSNVMLNRRQEPVVMDFGLARLANSGDARLTRDGEAMGTPAYMPPEQVRGDLDAMGPGCDIYSLGAVLYELLTGKTPFHGSIAEIMSQVLYQQPPRPSTLTPGLAPDLEQVCSKAMAKKIDDRFASMTDFAGALTAYLGDNEPSTTATVTLPAPRSRRRRPMLIWLGLVALLIVSAGTAAFLAFMGSGQHEQVGSSQPGTVPSAPLARRERPFRDAKYVLSSIHDHLEKLPRADRPFQRYFTLTNLHNNQALTKADLDQARAALSKAVDSLSSKEGVGLPKAIDDDQIVLRVDLRKLGWDRIWPKLLADYPYGLKYNDDHADYVYERTETDLPFIRADWFIAVAAPKFRRKEHKDPAESIGVITRYHKDLNLDDAALEVGSDNPLVVSRAIKDNKTIAALGALLQTDGTISRGKWASLDNANSLCQELANAMNLGIPKHEKGND